jgi:hypothetical protein
MISRNRSEPTAATISVECTTSANRTVTCLYSAGVVGTDMGDPHSSQNFAVGRNSAPHLVQANAAVIGPRIGPRMFAETPKNPPARRVRTDIVTE